VRRSVQAYEGKGERRKKIKIRIRIKIKIKIIWKTEEQKLEKANRMTLIGTADPNGAYRGGSRVKAITSQFACLADSMLGLVVL